MKNMENRTRLGCVVHLVYPFGARISTPDAIGRKLGEELQKRGFIVRHYNYDERRAITPHPGDILIGHPHPDPSTIFRLSLPNPAWRRKLILAPFAPDPRQVAFLDTVVPNVDRYLAITGNYWYREVAQTIFAHWQPKMIHMDLAVDREDFPAIKHSFHPPGERRFLYIGHTAWYKNTAYLAQLAAKMPHWHWGWMGGGVPIKNFRPLGSQDFRSQEARQSVSEYDFLITVGRFDANPTTLLEAMAWGLIPVCTPQSGYDRQPGMINIPLDAPDEAIAMLQQLQFADDLALRSIQQRNWAMLDQHFNWQRFGAQVEAAIDADDSPSIGNETLHTRIQILYAVLQSPYSPFSLRTLLRRWLDHNPTMAGYYRRLRGFQ